MDSRWFKDANICKVCKYSPTGLVVAAFQKFGIPVSVSRHAEHTNACDADAEHVGCCCVRARCLHQAWALCVCTSSRPRLHASRMEDSCNSRRRWGATWVFQPEAVGPCSINRSRQIYTLTKFKLHRSPHPCSHNVLSTQTTTAIWPAAAGLICCLHLLPPGTPNHSASATAAI